MHVFDPVLQLKSALKSALSAFQADAPPVDIIIMRPKNAEHGDFSTNLAMLLAKLLRQPPRQIATELIRHLPPQDWLASCDIAGAGFINFTLTPHSKLAVIHTVRTLAADYGRSSLGNNKRLLLEYVSANPTGPLHVGHGRGAAYGASLANLLKFAGWQVDQEYYVNDAGRQMDILGLSTWLRYLQRCAYPVDFPKNAYQGDYIVDMAEALLAQDGRLYCPTELNLPQLPALAADEATIKAAEEAHIDALIAYAQHCLQDHWSVVRQHALTVQLADCRDDLSEFGVMFDRWYSEQSLFERGKIAEAVGQLTAGGHTYQQDGALWFRSTTFGDEKDRVIQRENGQYTYFASDIAYHLEKFGRGYDSMIDIWGADHHGYIGRVKGAMTALACDVTRLNVVLVQFAVLYRNQEKMSMSTRSGTYVTLRTLRQDVGNDACRFFYILRKSDQHLDFDLDLAKSNSHDNPVYYIQYAHARACSLLRDAAVDYDALDLTQLQHPRELQLAGKIQQFGEIVEEAARDLAPHQIAYYLKDLVALFHAWYNDVRILQQTPSLTNARLALVAAFRQIIHNGMLIIGVSCPDSM